MRIAPISCVLAIVLAAVVSVDAQTADEQAIRAMIKGFSDIWARADVKAFEQLLTEDADWVVRSGTYLKGRPAVVKHHANIMTGSFNGSSVAWQLLDLRFVRPDVAIAHIAAELTLRDGTKRPPGSVTIVFLKTANGWRITAVQNTDQTAQ